jgi:vancomycin resistance protein VanJ
MPTVSLQRRRARRGPGLFHIVAAIYLVGLLTWWIASVRFGDRWLWLFLLNCVAFYLFLPLPFALMAAGAGQSLALRAGAVLGLVLFVTLYGRQVIPRPARQPAPALLTVMTYNTLAHNRHPEALAEAVAGSGADVVAMQELSVANIAALEPRIAAFYPYHILAAGRGRYGMGVWSRYPLRDTGQSLAGPWLREPQVLEVLLPGVTVTLINVHNVSLDVSSPRWWARVHRTAPARERAAQSLTAFARAHDGPLVVLGDFNTVDQSRAYRLLRAELWDSWEEAGTGPGKTFPGTGAFGAGRPHLGPLPLPRWLARIDYVFHSADLRATAAWLGPWDGGSDHRPVVARLALAPADRIPPSPRSG